MNMIYAGMITLLISSAIFLIKKPRSPWAFSLTAILLICDMAGYCWFCQMKPAFAFGGTDSEFFWQSFKEGLWQPRIILIIYIVSLIIFIIALCNDQSKPICEEEADEIHSDID